MFARRRRAALAAVAVRRRARVARAGLDRAPLRDRERRAGRHLPDHARARVARPPLLAVGARPEGDRAPLERVAAAPDEAALHLPRLAGGARLRALDRAATWPSPRAGRPSTRCCGCRAAGRAPTSSRTTSPSSSPPPRSRCSPSTPTASGLPCIASSRMAGRAAPGALRRPGHGVRSTASSGRVLPRCPDVPRRGDTVVFYARDHTPRRAVELGLLALQLLVERRPHLRVVLYGTHRRIKAPFAFEQLGVERHRSGCGGSTPRPRSASASRSPTTP